MLAFYRIATDTVRMTSEKFIVEIKGTSHGVGISTNITGCPEGIELDYDFIQQELTRRRPGQALTTERQESDEFEIMSGVTIDGYTTGEPLELFVPNTGQHSHAYDKLANILRPGHGITMQMLKAHAENKKIETSGGGQASARLTIGNVAAGAIAQLGMNQLLNDREISVLACIEQIGHYAAKHITHETELTEEQIYRSKVRYFQPDSITGEDMEAYIEDLVSEGDSAGGTVYCCATGFPGGVGERPGTSLDARLMGALANINAVKGVIIGDPNPHTSRGSEYLDEIMGFTGTDLHSDTNHGGGVLGGLSTGAPIEIRTLFRPTSSIRREVRTVDLDNQPHIIQLGKEDRHDPCVAIRGVEVVKGVVRTVLFQAWLENQTR